MLKLDVFLAIIFQARQHALVKKIKLLRYEPGPCAKIRPKFLVHSIKSYFNKKCQKIQCVVFSDFSHY